MTAAAAARGVRDGDAKGSIAIIGADPHPPYNCPPLTKGLRKTDAPDSVWRKTEEAHVDLHRGRRRPGREPLSVRRRGHGRAWGEHR